MLGLKTRFTEDGSPMMLPNFIVGAADHSSPGDFVEYFSLHSSEQKYMASFDYLPGYVSVHIHRPDLSLGIFTLVIFFDPAVFDAGWLFPNAGTPECKHKNNKYRK
jgi:hypothetical protein